jgi:hypothetical protein
MMDKITKIQRGILCATASVYNQNLSNLIALNVLDTVYLICFDDL